VAPNSPMTSAMLMNRFILHSEPRLVIRLTCCLRVPMLKRYICNSATGSIN